MPHRPGDTCRLTVERIGADALGEVDLDGLTWRLPGTAPGDDVTATLEAVSQHHAHGWARVDTVHQRGDAFRVPDCPHAAPLRGGCGGCASLHLRPPAAARALNDRVTAALSAHDLVDELPPLALHAAPAERRYRNRGIFQITRAAGRPALAARAPRTGELVPLHTCNALRPGVFEAASAALDAWTAFDDTARLRYIVARGDARGQAIIEWIVEDERAPNPATVRAALMAPHVAGVAWSPNPRRDNVIRAEPPRWLAGAATLALHVSGIDFQLSTGPFAQLNDAVASRLVEHAASAAGAPRCVWDLYGGVGTFGVAIGAQTGATIYLAERDPVAVEVATRAASETGVTLIAKAIDLSASIPAWPAPDVVVIDPPRRGLSPVVRDALARIAAPLVYVSCSAESFARDARWLRDRGWRCTTLEGFDMLPTTAHVELLSFWTPPSA